MEEQSPIRNKEEEKGEEANNGQINHQVIENIENYITKCMKNNNYKIVDPSQEAKTYIYKIVDPYQEAKTYMEHMLHDTALPELEHHLIQQETGLKFDKKNDILEENNKKNDILEENDKKNDILEENDKKNDILEENINENDPNNDPNKEVKKHLHDMLCIHQSLNDIPDLLKHTYNIVETSPQASLQKDGVYQIFYKILSITVNKVIHKLNIIESREDIIDNITTIYYILISLICTKGLTDGVCLIINLILKIYESLNIRNFTIQNKHSTIRHFKSVLSVIHPENYDLPSSLKIIKKINELYNNIIKNTNINIKIKGNEDYGYKDIYSYHYKCIISSYKELIEKIKLVEITRTKINPLKKNIKELQKKLKEEQKDLLKIKEIEEVYNTITQTYSTINYQEIEEEISDLPSNRTILQGYIKSLESCIEQDNKDYNLKKFNNKEL